MRLNEVLPELVLDVEGALVRLGRGHAADQLRTVPLTSHAFDAFAQATYLQLSGERDRDHVEETLSLYDDIGVNVDLDREGRVIGLEVFGYEDYLARLHGHQG